MNIYGDIPINPPARRFTTQELERALDEVIAGRTNFNVPGNGERNQSGRNARPASGNRPRQRTNGPGLGQPIQEDVLELPDTPNPTQSASSVCPTSGRRPRQRKRNPSSRQPTVEDDLELPDAPDTQSSSGGRPASGRRSRQRTHNPRSRQHTVEDDLELPDAPNTPSAIGVRPASGGMPWQRTNNSRLNLPMLEDGLGLPKPTEATPVGQSPWTPAPVLEKQNVPLRSFPWDGPVRQARQNDAAMAEAPPASISNPRDRAEQLRIPVPTGPMSDVRPAPSLIPASAIQSAPAFRHGIANQSTMPVPTGPRSGVRPAPSFTPTSAPQSGPAIPLGRWNQLGMPIPTGPRSSMGHVMNNQPRASVPNPSASQEHPAYPPYLAATPSSPFQVPKPPPASAAPSSPVSLDPRRWPGAEARAKNIDLAHSSNTDSRCQSNSSIIHDSATDEAPSRSAFHPQKRRPGHEQVSASNSGPAHNLPRDAAIQPSSATLPYSAKLSDPYAVGKGPDETRTSSTPEGASSTRIPQSYPAQSFAQAPPSPKASNSSFFSSQSEQIPGLSSESDSTKASLSHRKFKITRMRLVEDAVTVRSGYALFWV